MNSMMQIQNPPPPYICIISVAKLYTLCEKMERSSVKIMKKT